MNAGPGTSLAGPPVTASRRRILARTRLDFWLDGLLLVTYTFAYSLGFTGIAFHEWLGIGLGVVLLVHLTLHWDWVVRTTRKLFSRGGRERAICVLCGMGRMLAGSAADGGRQIRSPWMREW